MLSLLLTKLTALMFFCHEYKPDMLVVTEHTFPSQDINCFFIKGYAQTRSLKQKKEMVCLIF